MPRPFAMIAACLGLLAGTASFGLVAPAAGQTYEHAYDPYASERPSKLTTPQWVGEPGVEAVVVLAIDDMRDPAVYEKYLRPILDRLKKIDGRAPVSIMTCRVDPKDPRLQGWIKEGLSLEVHTLTHPCPCLQKGDFAEAARTYHGCVDLMNEIPGNKPVAFRMPCCDSINSVSPRFFAEIFSKTSPKGHFLSIDSSVFTVLTPDDPALPRNLVFEADGKERFRKYIPFPSFVNTIENHPYPYIIGQNCWEFPCIVPSDWEAQNIHKPANAKTLEDMKACARLRRAQARGLRPRLPPRMAGSRASRSPSWSTTPTRHTARRSSSSHSKRPWSGSTRTISRGIRCGGPTARPIDDSRSSRTSNRTPRSRPAPRCSTRRAAMRGFVALTWTRMAGTTSSSRMTGSMGFTCSTR